MKKITIRESNTIRSLWKRIRNLLVVIFLVSQIVNDYEPEVSITILLTGFLYVISIWILYKFIFRINLIEESKLGDMYVGSVWVFLIIFLVIIWPNPWLDGFNMIVLVLLGCLLPSMIDNNYNIYVFKKRSLEEKNNSSRNLVKNKLKDVDLNDRT